MNISGWTSHRRISNLYLGAIIVFAVISLLSIGIARLEHLMPDGRLMIPKVFGQLLGLHQVLLHFFVLLPVIPAVMGYAMLPPAAGMKEVAFPRLALTSWVLFVLGGLLVLGAFVWSGIEPGWAYAVVSPVTSDLVSSPFLVGLFLACLSLQLTGIVMLVTLQRGRARPDSLFCRSLYCTSWLMVLAIPIMLSTISLAIAEKHLALGVFDARTGGESTFLAFLAALASTPMQVIVLLPALGLVCAVFRPERVLPAPSVRFMGWCMVALAAFSVFAVDMRALPRTDSPEILLFSSFNRALLMAPLFAIVMLLLHAALKQHVWGHAARMYAFGALLLMLLLVPLDFFLSVPSSAIYTSGYLGSASYYLLVGGGCLLALFGGLHHFLGEENGAAPSTSPAIWFAVTLFLGLVFTFFPMLLMGPSILSMEMAVYPARFAPLQTLVLFGGTILVIGMTCSALQLLVGRVRARGA